MVMDIFFGVMVVVVVAAVVWVLVLDSKGEK
jgi:hypothetical protein